MTDQLRVLAALSLSALLLSSCGGRFQEVPTSPPAVQTKEFALLMSDIARAPWVDGNHTRTLENGNGYFPVMLAAIQKAQKSITFETYVFKQSSVGRKFSTAFARAAQRGVKVHVLLDTIGSRWIDDENIALMKRAGVEVYLFRPLDPLRPHRYNARTHRKIMVVDGKLAYTGGAGYSDLWVGDAKVPHHWRDTQYEIRGPVVRQLQHGFNENWRETSGREVQGPDYFPPLARAGNQVAHFSLGSPEKSGDTLGSTYLLAINAARKSILIEHAYFIPHRDLLEALLRARRRGVEVDVIVCGEHTDFPIGRVAQRSALLELTRAGARVWEYHTTMMHGKLVVVDDFFSAVGSANFDDRSFFINDEANLNVLDPAFAAEQRRMFQRDLKHCKLLTPADLKLRLHQVPGEIGTKLIKSQL